MVFNVKNKKIVNYTLEAKKKARLKKKGVAKKVGGLNLCRAWSSSL
jgi:hypothetical protein